MISSLITPSPRAVTGQGLKQLQTWQIKNYVIFKPKKGVQLYPSGEIWTLLSEGEGKVEEKKLSCFRIEMFSQKIWKF